MRSFARFSALLTLFLWAATAADPPEIVATNRSFAGFEPVFLAAPVSAQLLGMIRATTWHTGCPVPPEDLRELTVAYWNFGRMPTTGVLVVHKDVAQELADIFRELFNHGFLIQEMKPIEEYNGDDNASMAANNTSAFNCRDVTGSPGKFSNHSWGRAIDINPLTNPYIKGDKVLPPEGRQYLDRTRAFPGSILSDSFVVRRFAQSDWTWGGSWSDRKDYQHFEKTVGGS